ncbi:bifunctional oligoribonuclease/PAP phosphatase NrnA [Lentisphaerota bacterium WC36G]|nr:bifunctional oligoribonuclease/PAP phosphatase NrnA [Lentisphaerae bacterium WC36]
MNNKNNVIESVAKFLQENNNFLIVCHERPDGDALGSTFALLNCLRENGKRVTAYLPEEIPTNYIDFVPGDYRAEIDLLEISDFNSIICLDIAASVRTGLGGKYSLKDVPVQKINIDHHPDNGLFGDVNLIMPECASTSQILFKVLGQAKFEISPKTATLLMLALVTDSGCFRFANTDEDAFLDASKIMKLGADHQKIINNMFFSKPLSYIHFESDLMLNHLKKGCDGRFAYINVPRSLREKYGVDTKNSENLIECVRAINNMDVVALMNKCDTGYKVSLRSKNAKYSVGSVARKLGGGGHELAAGCFIKAANFAKAEEILLDHISRLLRNPQAFK